MAIRVTDRSLDEQVLHVLSMYKETALEKFEEYLGDAPPTLTEERMLAFWEHLDGRRGWDGIPQIEEYYGALLLGPILQLQRWVEQPPPCIVPSGMVLGRLVQIGLLMADATAQLAQRKNEKDATSVEVEREMLREFARRAVSQRSDQQLKPGWQDHCRRAINGGRTIQRLNDLLEIPGYDPEITKIQPPTLRRWASEVGVVFKSGRPKN